MIRDIRLAVLLAAVALLPLGCASSDSFSDSSESSIDSSTSPSRSSASSSPEDRGDAYRDEVRTYTAGYARGGGLPNDAYKKQIADIARRYSFSNWEDKKDSFRGIGEGLGQAGATQAQVDAYMAAMAGSDPDKRKRIQEGYNSKKP